jgi:hypothetical protein
MHGVITEICLFYGRVKKTKTFLKVICSSSGLI